MLITVWRHGEAGQAAEDRLRELTARGERDIPLGARNLGAICEQRGAPPPDALWYSRWRRTERTAQLIAEQFSPLTPVAEEALIPGAAPADVDAALEPLWRDGAPAPEHLVLVSHQPLVSSLVDHLVGARRAAPPHPPGGLVTLEVHAPAAGGASLAWWAFPPEYGACL